MMQCGNVCKWRTLVFRSYAPAAFKASVWKYFGFAAYASEEGVLKSDRSKVVCKICHANLKYSGNTTNLHTHLVRHHPDLKANAVCETKQSSEKIHSTQTLLNFSRRGKLDTRRSAEITNAIAKFIIKDLRPYSVVESEGFLNMMKVIASDYKVPSRKHFSDRIIPLIYNEQKTEILKTLKLVDYVSLTTDGWTSRTTVSYVTITCHFIDNNWNLQNFVLQTRPMCESHTAVNVASVLVDATREWGFEGKVVALVTDNASNMVAAAREGHFRHVGCFAHTLNLASQKSLKIAARVLACIRRVVSFFHRSAKATAILEDKQALLNLPKHKLKQDVVTRWNSSYDMVTRYIEQQPAVQATLLSKEVRRGDVPGTLGDSDLSTAEDIIQVMQPMKSATVALCDEKEPTLSIVAPLYHRLLAVTSEENRKDNSPVMRNLRKVVHDDLLSRYPDKSLMQICSAMDPRFKGLNFLSDAEKQGVFADIAVEAAGLPEAEVTVKEEPQEVDTQPLPQLPDLGSKDEDQEDAVSVQDQDATGPSLAKQPKIEHHAKVNKCALDDLLGEVLITKCEAGRKSSLDMANDEVNKYKDIPVIPLCANPLTWWRENAFMFPKLSLLAKKYLCIPGTSVPSERVFSTAGDILSASRANLKSHHVDMLLFLKKNMKL